MKPERHTLRRITLYVVGASVLLSALAFALGGVAMGLGAVAGGALGVANWLAMRWLGHRLLVANDKGRAIWGALLVVKMTALLGITWAVLATGWVHPSGFAIGLSGLVLGAIGGAFHAALTGERSAHDAEEQS